MMLYWQWPFLILLAVLSLRARCGIVLVGVGSFSSFEVLSVPFAEPPLSVSRSDETRLGHAAPAPQTLRLGSSVGYTAG
jgi:hypothetical protein